MPDVVIESATPGMHTPPRPVTALRQDYLAGKAALQARFANPSASAPLLRKLARLTDQTLAELWNRHRFPVEALLIAVGGYGRGELFPHSDVDLLILLPDQPSPALLEKLEIFVGELWDVGLEVGHSVRTLADCLNEAEKDITVQTALLECRRLTGDAARFTQFRDTVHRYIDPKEFFDAKLLEQQARYGRFQNATYKLEPNLKEAPGGLRDLHLVGWIAAALGLGRDWRALAALGMLTREESQKLRRAERTLRVIRIQLHWLAKRREDRILFDYQNTLARDFGFHDDLVNRGSERLMAHYYRAARIVSQLTPLLVHALRGRIFSQIGVKVVPLNARFQLRGSVLETTAPDIFQREPSAILELFLLFEQQREITDIAPETLRALWHARAQIDDGFRANPLNKLLFIQLFREPRGLTRVLRRMNQYGVLGRYIPKFGDLVGRMQHDLFHVYTVDEHTLMVLRNMRRFAVPAFTHEYPLCSRLIEEFARPEVLYLAALFHDIGKGRGGDHSKIGRDIAAEFVNGHPLPNEDREIIPWLVEHHLTMSHVAQKQDVYDPEVVQEFATLVGDQRRLTALYLLTVADIRGTSPKVWNAWKAKLLEDLFKATQRYLAQDQIQPATWLEERQDEALRLVRLYGLREDAHQDFWNELDTVYFLRHDAREIAWHTRMLFNRLHTKEPVVRARLSESGEGLQVLVYTPDIPDLFARICAFFERAGYSIFDAHIHTTRSRYALDSFYVFIPEQRGENYRDLIGYVEYELGKQLQEAGPLPAPVKARISRQQKHFPVQPHVLIRPDERGKYNVLAIAAGDRPGLLSTIARVLAAHRVDIQSAKIMTLGERAEDHFLISGPILGDDMAVRRMENELLQAIQPN
ncbi:UTP--GlnB (protein PII) uridylyltransferase, GlnD [Andreprevotia lacus DSM 23236]|jgi:[protein-PII] uridylyltransferase|uniref:Bifunctional uridylyltransferase/uridylyl-removing enzyme n=1 Tax=Andreprevotia lacus DSM 23236 TaxID=1121001 RepID=A0A1W1XE81_9NEIS|nr:[protein-PII] uridylyltransferase [Andreprevotia lacus]SMC21948.1 UTP--GlnB (protein PII) uridylyltransferase, GlnD [Andreprevotia lacus DSM 23236]